MNRALASLLLAAVALAPLAVHAAGPTPSSVAPETDRAALLRLNGEYLKALSGADGGWYREHLSDDFRGTFSDGSVVDKAVFIERLTAHKTDVLGLYGIEVDVAGDTARVQTLMHHWGQGGTTLRTRLSHTYVRANGAWQVVASQLTRDERT
jgi:hypothetical protein